MKSDYGNFEISIECKICGSKNIKVSRDVGYTFDGTSDVLAENGNVELKCADCGITDCVYIPNC